MEAGPADWCAWECSRRSPYVGRTARRAEKQPPVSSARDRRIGARGVRLPGDPAAADAIGSSWPAGVLADPPTQPSSAEAVELPGMKQKPSDHRVGWPCHLSRATLLSTLRLCSACYVSVAFLACCAAVRLTLVRSAANAALALARCITPLTNAPPSLHSHYQPDGQNAVTARNRLSSAPSSSANTTL